MIEATLTRIPQRTQTLGKLIVRRNNAVIFDCDTIELPWLNNQPQISCIPIGTYNVVYRESAKSAQIKCKKNGVKTSFFVVALTLLITKFIQLWKNNRPQ